MNTLAFLAFLLGIISILIAMQYAKTCDTARMLTRVASKSERSSELDKYIFSIQEKTGLNDTDFQRKISQKDIQEKIISLLK